MHKFKTLKIIYATSTGTAYDVCQRLTMLFKNQPELTNVINFSIEDYNYENLLNDHFLIFICSTAGEGEFPFQMKEFWKFLLLKKHSNNLLFKLNYAVFGLGDSSYKKFNYPAKKLHNRLKQLGGNPFCSVGLGDDQHNFGIEHELRRWLEELSKTMNIKKNTKLPNPTYQLIKSVENHEKEIETNLYKGKIKKNQRLTHVDHFQEIRHLEIVCDDSLIYNPGDAVSIKPENSESDVTEFMTLTGLLEKKDDFYELIYKVDEKEIKQVMRLKDLIKKKLDIRSTPKYGFLEYMKEFCTENELYKEKIEEWLNVKEGYKDFFEYSAKQKRTTLEFLRDFRINIPLEYLFDTVTPIFPRYFSIASSNKKYRNEVHVMLGVIKYKTRIKELRQGLCTNWISKSLGANDCLQFGMAKGSLYLPNTDNTPVIMVAPGLGVAPMRSIIQQRLSNNQHENYLFVGSRHKDIDFCYQSEWESYSKDGKLKVFAAFSRDQKEKIYVQHLLMHNKELIRKLITENNAHVYVCGSSGNMPKQVMQTIREILANDDVYAEMEKYMNTPKGRFWIESWG